MATTFSIEEMTTAEKLAAMELLWSDLSKTPSDIPSPEWHERILRRRVEDLKAGRDQIMDWEEAKRSILDSVS